MIKICNSLTTHDTTYQSSLPTEEVISSLLMKGVVSMSLNLSLNYANFILDKGLVKISVVFSLVEIYWRTTSPLWTLSWRK
jgi:hypothetical protein